MSITSVTPATFQTAAPTTRPAQVRAPQTETQALPADKVDIKTQGTGEKILRFVGSTVAGAVAGAAGAVGTLTAADLMLGGQFGGAGTFYALQGGALMGGAVGILGGAIAGKIVESPAHGALLGGAVGAAGGLALGAKAGLKLALMLGATGAIAGAASGAISAAIQKK